MALISEQVAMVAPDVEGDQRIALRGFRWRDYQALLEVLGEQAGVRVSYSGGIVELMSPSGRHEHLKKLLARLLELYALERDIDIAGRGSQTLKKRKADKGAEPDECYYLNRAPTGFPDLAIEVVLHSGVIDKLELYAALEVKELWLWQEDRLSVHTLRGGRYHRATRSRLFPELDLEDFARFARYEDQARAVREYRRALRSHH